MFHISVKVFFVIFNFLFIQYNGRFTEKRCHNKSLVFCDILLYVRNRVLAKHAGTHSYSLLARGVSRGVYRRRRRRLKVFKIFLISAAAAPDLLANRRRRLRNFKNFSCLGGDGFTSVA